MSLRRPSDSAFGAVPEDHGDLDGAVYFAFKPLSMSEPDAPAAGVVCTK